MIENQNVRHWYIYKITSPADRIYIGKTTNFKKENNLIQELKKTKLLYILP
jgi:hypothetical protein